MSSADRVGRPSPFTIAAGLPAASAARPDFHGVRGLHGPDAHVEAVWPVAARGALT